jgi:hypothetical protein
MGSVAGISDHYGRAVFVCVALRAGVPVVVERRGVELIDAGLPSAPYHHETLGMEEARAEALVRAVRESAGRCAERALRGLGDVAAIAMRVPPLARMPASVAEVHASYAVTNRADGMIYHDALARAAERLGIAVERIARGAEVRRAEAVLGGGLEAWMAEARARLGPPWRKEHREAAARALAVLPEHA